MRVIPRDLFNQANLMENIGRLYIQLETIGKEDMLQDRNSEKDSFEMAVDEYSNTQRIVGVFLRIDGEEHSIFRPINSREKYSIYVQDGITEEEYEVFTSDGKLSAEFTSYLNGETVGQTSSLNP